MLAPKYLGPYKIVKVSQDYLNVTLDLPYELKQRGIHPTFHVKLIRPYIANNDSLFPKRDTSLFYDFGESEEQEWFVDEILDHKWVRNNLQLRVLWTLGDRT